jgi:hypothetical protein
MEADGGLCGRDGGRGGGSCVGGWVAGWLSHAPFSFLFQSFVT